MTDKNLTILALSGSLRKHSFNTALLHEAQALTADAGMSIAPHDYSDVPLYNADLDGDAQPESVLRLKEAIRAADGLLIATPEFNYSIPGVLKNALDWASRPGYQSVLVHKPVAMLSAAPSPTGGVRAQGHLKTILLGVLALPFPNPETVIPAVHTKMDSGKLTDAPTRDALQRMLTRYGEWIRTLPAKA